MSRSVLVIFSGGQDSTTCLHWALKNFERVEALTFDYGQRHSIELEQSRQICKKYRVQQTVLNLSELGLFAENALVSNRTPIVSHDDKTSLPNTFVPARNLVFLTLAASMAVRKKIDNLVLGACQADFSGYPDCREIFMDSFEKTLSLALGDESLKVHTPLMNLTKSQIFALAHDLGVLENVIEDSHTCYEGDRTLKHAWGYGCAKCPACLLRKKGFEEFTLNRKFV